MEERIFFHIDVNSAFLSWTALSLLQEGNETDLRLIPSIVGGDMAKRHGVVLAKSLPAKAYGKFIDVEDISQNSSQNDNGLIQSDAAAGMGLSNQTGEDTDDGQKCENACCHDPARADPHKGQNQGAEGHFYPVIEHQCPTPSAHRSESVFY